MLSVAKHLAEYAARFLAPLGMTDFRGVAMSGVS